MKVEAIGAGNLRIWLSDKEMEHWGIGEPSSPDCRRATDRLLRRVIRVARRYTGRPDSRFLVEEIPVEGGCLLLVTVRYITDGAGPYVYWFDTADALFSFAERLRPAPDDPGAGWCFQSLYERPEGGYWLLCYPIVAAGGRLPALEYACPVGCGAVAAALVEERGRLLVAGNAIERLTARVPALPTPADREI